MREFKVSLIVPCYNIDSIDFKEVNPFFNMVDSIVNQSFGIDDIEVLFVDDCSTDNTRNVLNDLSEKYPSFHPIFLEENSGRPSIPRNVGIDNASSEYIMFLDQDDFMDFLCVEKLYDEITCNDVDFVKSNYSIVMGDDILNYDTGRNERLVIKPKSRDMVYLVSHFIWGSIYSKNFLDKYSIRFPDTQAEDNLFLSKCYNYTEKNIISLNDYYSIKYTANNNNSLSHSFDLKQINDYENIYEETTDSFIEHNQSDKFVSLNIERYIIILIGSLLRSRESFKTKKSMVKIIKKYILKYEDYAVSLPLKWNFFSFLIKHEFSFAIHLSSIIINTLFENPLFIRLFRNKDYDN
ncbi:MAG: glycosyltransferase family 2 protein [Methanosphaera sp.]|nr:glycosyltransferase family 2 protein [Methanosphaera sp.]